MTTRIAPKSPLRPSKKPDLAQKAVTAEKGKEAAKAFKKDEMSTGRGKKLQEALARGIGKKPGIGELGRLLHNLDAARHLKGAIQNVLKLVRFAGPLPKEAAPRMGPNGQMVAPNGDPLIRVKLSDGPVSGSSQYGLVNPKTNEFYLQNNGGGFLHPTTYNGPLSLPPSARFEGDKFTPADLKQLEKVANTEVHHFPLPPLFPQLPGPTLEQLKRALAVHQLLGDLEFDHPAPKPGAIASETRLRTEHPFTYYAVVLKDDPTHVIIKKVLTGGFAPPKPGDGTYSQPILVGPIGVR